jgi:hypothetical protein
MAVRCVFAETDVGYDEELREALTQETNAGHDWTLWIVGSGSKRIFSTRCNWYTKEYDGF